MQLITWCRFRAFRAKEEIVMDEEKIMKLIRMENQSLMYFITGISILLLGAMEGLILSFLNIMFEMLLFFLCVAIAYYGYFKPSDEIKKCIRREYGTYNLTFNKKE